MEVTILTELNVHLYLILTAIWPYYQVDCISKVAVLPKWPYYQGHCITMVVVLSRRLHYQGGCITKVAVK